MRPYLAMQVDKVSHLMKWVHQIKGLNPDINLYADYVAGTVCFIIQAHQMSHYASSRKYSKYLLPYLLEVEVLGVASLEGGGGGSIGS